MKLIKGILLTLVISSIFAITNNAKASDYYMTYNQISIPANLFGNYYSDGFYDKINDYSHKLYTQNNSRSVSARINCTTGASDWKTAVVGSWINWGSQCTSTPDLVELNIKSSSSIFSANYWGTWHFNLP